MTPRPPLSIWGPILPYAGETTEADLEQDREAVVTFRKPGVGWCVPVVAAAANLFGASDYRRLYRLGRRPGIDVMLFTPGPFEYATGIDRYPAGLPFRCPVRTFHAHGIAYDQEACDVADWRDDGFDAVIAFQRDLTYRGALEE